MAKEGIGRVIRIGRGNTRYITIPADVAKDDRFPFEDGEKVKVIIENGKLVIKKTDA